MNAPMASVDVSEAARRLRDEPDTVLLDVRERDEFAGVRAPGAALVPMSELAQRVGELPDRPLLVICHSGNRSLAVTSYLRHLGRDAANVAGGMVAWERAGLPVATGAPAAGEGDLPAA